MAIRPLDLPDLVGSFPASMVQKTDRYLIEFERYRYQVSKIDLRGVKTKEIVAVMETQMLQRRRRTKAVVLCRVIANR